VIFNLYLLIINSTRKDTCGGSLQLGKTLAAAQSYYLIDLTLL